jgi:rhodanese-related sulfurtransferase
MVAARLARAGITARCVRGGIEAWTEARLPVEPLSPARPSEPTGRQR